MPTRELISIIDPDERNAKLLEAYQIHIDEGPITIGTVGEHPNALIVKNNLRNVPDFGLTAGWDLAFPRHRRSGTVLLRSRRLMIFWVGVRIPTQNPSPAGQCRRVSVYATYATYASRATCKVARRNE